ncbi:TolC family outer membrane protein [Methylotenera sp.]|uniref:TolC family outer membrane protein n=1 Tax=Methylotenera sp. TaxID=2051956 RepID=UPI0024889AE3|nr:TolC family outer membrane protein [Methylotenera sp.]MDI1298395.1 TolC family outer membrane protein [Methylotenera sp.]
MNKLARTRHLNRLHRAIFLACITLSVSESVFAAKMLATKDMILVAESAPVTQQVAISTINTPYNTISLLDLYHQAVSHDPTLASALSANQAAQEIIEQGKALYRPTVNFNAEANAVKTDIRYLNSNAVPGQSNFETYKAGIEASQPIYRKQNLVQIEQTQTQVSQADKQLHLSQQDLILRTTQRYFDVLIAQDKIDLIGAQKTAILSQLEQAKANFEVGTATITDVNEAQARYDLITAQEIAAVNEYQIAQRNVQAITGEMPPKLATVRADIQPNALAQGMDKWLEVAEQNNLNIQIQQDALKFSDQEIDRSKAGHLPTLDAVASVSESYVTGSASIYGAGNDLKTGTIGLQLQIPLYQGGATSSKVRQAVLNKQKAQDDVEIARRQAALETQSAYLNLSTTIAQIKALEQALISSQSQVDSTKLGYEVGVRTSVDVLNAEQQLFSAKRDLLQARYNYLVNIIRLKAASGVLAEADLVDINQQLVLSH